MTTVYVPAVTTGTKSRVVEQVRRRNLAWLTTQGGWGGDHIPWKPRDHGQPGEFQPLPVQPGLWSPNLVAFTQPVSENIPWLRRQPPEPFPEISPQSGPPWGAALATGTPLPQIAFVPLFPPPKPPDVPIDVGIQPRGRWNPALLTGTPLTPIAYVPFRFQDLATLYREMLDALLGDYRERPNPGWFPWMPPPPTPLPTPLPLLQRDPTLNPRERRNWEILSEIVNSLLMTGQLIPLGGGQWKLVPPP